MTNKNGKTFILSGCLSKLEIPPRPLKLSEPEGRDGVGSQSQRELSSILPITETKDFFQSNE